MHLHEIAHSRTGDKGKQVCISLLFNRDQDYDLLVKRVTVDVVSSLFSQHITEPVARYCGPNLTALNFVLRRPNTESVPRLLGLDALMARDWARRCSTLRVSHLRAVKRKEER